MTKKRLPLVGPITYYLPIKNGCPSTDGLTGERRLIAQAELRVVRGEFEGLDRFYAAVRKDGRYFLTAAGVALFGAVATDDPLLFDTVLKDIAAYPSRYGTPEAELAVEILMVWLHNFLQVPMKCPEWLADFDLAAIPAEWRHQVSFLAVWYLKQKGEYKAAAILVDVLLNLEPGRAVKSSAADIFLKMAKAKLCCEAGRMDEAARWCQATVESAKPLGIVLPFLGVLLGPKSVPEEVPLPRALLRDAGDLRRRRQQPELPSGHRDERQRQRRRLGPRGRLFHHVPPGGGMGDQRGHRAEDAFASRGHPHAGDEGAAALHQRQAEDEGTSSAGSADARLAGCGRKLVLPVACGEVGADGDGRANG